MYTHNKIKPWRLASAFIRLVAIMLTHWPILLVIGYGLSPYALKLLSTYDYREIGTMQVRFNCQYIGLSGATVPCGGGECPVVILVDERDQSIVSF